MRTNLTIQDICELQGWWFDKGEDFTVLTRKAPSGYEFGFFVNNDYEAEEIAAFVEEFNEDAFVEDRIAERIDGDRKIPQSTEALLEDARWIKLLLGCLRNEIKYSSKYCPETIDV